MGYSFDGTNKVISCTAGTTEIDVRDLYSRWKDWAQSNPGYLQAFSVVGGEPIDVSEGVYVTTYVFLENDWKIKPQEADHKLRVYNGILLTSDGSDPFNQTTGSYNVLVQYSQPVRSETVALESGAPNWTTSEKAQIRHRLGIDGTSAAPSSGDPSLKDAIMAATVEGDYDLRDAIALMAASLLGLVSGVEEGQIEFKGIDGITTRISATIDANNNRSVVVLTP